MIVLGSGVNACAQSDPGPRGGSQGTGNPISGLSFREMVAFAAGKKTFSEQDDVKGTITGNAGLGPLFNMDGCAGCHAFPDVGGSSPSVNPQIAVATSAGESA